jgi:glycosyltransferase involved in cell wall biosynthesis
MKIVYFTDTYKPTFDGVVTSIDSFTQELQKKGHEVHIFYPAASGCPKRSKYLHPITSLPFWGYKGYRIGLPRLFKIKKLLKKIKPDIVHLQTPATLGTAGLIIARQLNIPTIATYHTLLPIYSKYIKIFGKEFALALVMFYTNFFFNLCYRVIVPSSPIKKILRSQGVWREIFVLPTGINLSKFNSVKIKSNPKSKILLHVGRICKEKSIDKLILAFAAISQIIPDAKFIITSDGPEKKKLQSLVKILHLQDKITFTGVLPDKELVKLYKKAKLFLSASKTETQGIVALEACAAGCPVLTPKALGFRDFVRNGINGFTYKNNSELVGRVIQIFHNAELRHKLVIGARKSATNLSIQKQANRLLSIYGDTINTYKNIMRRRAERKNGYL